ncbi:MAG: zinc carboxypeptidase, partial [Roseiflexaceae bacterium]|nr:zinc carboxypeptidase [Roseiflexaceae bacterium]
ADDGGGTQRYRVAGARSAALARAGAQIEGSGRGFVDIRANPATVAQLRAQGFRVAPLATPRVAVDPAYHTYKQMVAEVTAVASAHPQIVSLFSIGSSYERNDLLAAKLSDNVAQDEDEPEVLFVGHYHAREHLTVEMLLDILHMLADGYGQPERAALDALLDSREIWLVFDLNPDGGAYDIAGGTYKYWRKNRQPSGCAFDLGDGGNGNGTDPNRNHSYRWGAEYSARDTFSSGDPCSLVYRGTAPASAPEVAALERFVNSRVIAGVQQITVAMSFHTYGELLLWPYGYTAEDAPPDMPAEDAAALAALGRLMASSNGYVAQQASDLYGTNGDFADWAYGQHRIFAYTAEMSGYYNNTFYGFYPPAALIPIETARNRELVRLLIQHAGCPYALSGDLNRCTTPRFQLELALWLPLAAQDARR